MFDTIAEVAKQDDQRSSRRSSASYAGTMTVSAHDVAVVLRDRLPGLPTKKLHKLLYYCQGYHLAHFDKPLFEETISAWDMGPVVGRPWHQERIGETQGTLNRLDEAALNTIGYVVGRYGGLSGRDLENLTHNEAPWQLADSQRRPGDSVRIEPHWIRDYFRASIIADHEDDDLVLDSASVSTWLDGAESRRSSELSPDSPEALKARLLRQPLVRCHTSDTAQVTAFPDFPVRHGRGRSPRR